MHLVVALLAALVWTLGFAPATLAESSPMGQLATPSPTFGPTASPSPTVPPAPPIPRTTPVPGTITVDTRATATAAAATITAADRTATAVAGAPLTAIALTATAGAAATATRTSTPTPTPTSVPTATVAATPTTVPASPTAIPATATVVFATPPPAPTVDPLAATRSVLITAPLTVGEETIAPGAPVEVPLAVALQDGAIPPGTRIRLPSGQFVTVPPGTSIPAVESTVVVTAPLSAVLARPGQVGDTTYPEGTRLVLPSGTEVVGSLEPNAAILLRVGTVVQVEGRSQTLVEPLVVAVSPAPLAQPATLPATGDAAPVLWPALVGLALALLGWRLWRHA